LKSLLTATACCKLCRSTAKPLTRNPFAHLKEGVAQRALAHNLANISTRHAQQHTMRMHMRMHMRKH
jgi:hypothetical protein